MPRRIRGTTPRRKTFLREWREHRGMSQEDAAEKFGMSAAQLSRVENAVSPYTQDFIELAAQVYKTDEFSVLFRHPENADAIMSAIARSIADRRTGR